tara:strand:- start:407 stop:592 length:186 start_codon:yes stop_codon:yes gene_type:complete
VSHWAFDDRTYEKVTVLWNFSKISKNQQLIQFEQMKQAWPFTNDRRPLMAIMLRRFERPIF